MSRAVTEASPRFAPPRRSGGALRRVGAAIVTLALLALGLAGGLWLGSPASAAPSDTIEVKMPGDSAFSTTATSALLDIGALTPGGSASGTMTVRDASGNTSGADTISLQMVNVKTSATCPATQTCVGSGDALKDALDFLVEVTPDGGNSTSRSVGTADLVSGISLASGLHPGDTFGVTVTASLPGGVGNTVQYGRLAFNLALNLDSTTESGGSTSGTGNNRPGEAVVPRGPVVQNVGGGSHIQVLGTQSSVAGQPGAAPEKPGKGGVLVLGASKGSLSYTGAPITTMLAAGAAALLLGLIFLGAARYRSRRGAMDGGGPGS